MSQEGRSTATNNPNIVVLGQTGSGKSSLINMLAGRDIAKASSAHFGVTTDSTSYDIRSKANEKYTFWDTCGLNEGDKGNVPAQEAATKLIDLLKGLAVSLLIYIARGRFLDEVQANISLLRRIRSTCGSNVPIVLVVTDLQEEEPMDNWWTTNREDVEKLNLSFNGHACVTTTKGRGNMYEQKYQESRGKIWDLVVAYCKPSHNIILFGESGTGKSSIVNLIVDETVAKVSSSLAGCTFKHERYATIIGDTRFNIFDTAGLNEGEQGRVPHWQAIDKLYTLIRSLDGVSLLIYCMRGRVKENSQANWVLFDKVLCAGKVPIIAVETGLEREEKLDGRRAVLKKSLKGHGMVPKDVACIVSTRGKKDEHKELYIWSQNQLRRIITTSYRKEAWSMTTSDWVGHIYKTTYSTKLCLIPDVQVGFVEHDGNVIDEFIKQTLMKPEDSKRLKDTLLAAEKKLRKRKNFLNVL